MTSLRSFASTDRFITEIASPSTLRPGYVLIGDEIFLYDRCRKAVLATLAPEDTRDFCLHELDLADTSIFEILDRAQTPSLMAPFQVLFVRNLKTLYGRGSKKEEFAAIDAYFRSPNPSALILFIADHLRIPTDLRKMDYQDKERYERIRETLGDWCGFVELARVEESDAIKWVTTTAESRSVKFDPDAARELVDSLGADMMLIASEFEKLLLYVSAPIPNSNQAVVISTAATKEAVISTPATKEAVISTEGRALAAVVEKPAAPYKRTSALTFTPEVPAWLQPGRSATALLNGAPIAHFGELAHTQRDQRKLRQPIYLAQLDLAKLYELPLKKVTAHDLSRFQAVERDFSFTFPDTMQWHTIAAAIHALAIPELQRLTPTEIFRDPKGKSVPPAHYALLLKCVFQSNDRTLREDELTTWWSTIIATLTQLGGTIRAPGTSA